MFNSIQPNTSTYALDHSVDLVLHSLLYLGSEHAIGKLFGMWIAVFDKHWNKLLQTRRIDMNTYSLYNGISLEDNVSWCEESCINMYVESKNEISRVDITSWHLPKIFMAAKKLLVASSQSMNTLVIVDILQPDKICQVVEHSYNSSRCAILDANTFLYRARRDYQYGLNLYDVRTQKPELTTVTYSYVSQEPLHYFPDSHIIVDGGELLYDIRNTTHSFYSLNDVNTREECIPIYCRNSIAYSKTIYDLVSLTKQTLFDRILCKSSDEEFIVGTDYEMLDFYRI